ncbi:oligogalacturonate-specific porin KdgM family protein [Psychromonas sp. Urea-02u-13]|uniref:oligogalacturonate-specific porin KdgM family protein n=1 Tax=Psychromonas sp. Urea-02u-13 TaxID=2058326 RepID=UPI000C342EB0|nr:oligogalacturonate-specific porin KdgM family protein [Psychromonas sp. Urea-02u-13]PKG38211.1 porin [Psychromonas sp. Urea-02u-13]
MKKLTLAAACSSLLLSPIAFANTDTEVPQEPAGTTYVTGNIQMHDRKDFNGSDITSTLEAGHTFTTGTTILMEIDGVQLGSTDYGTDGADSSASAYTTLGVEQSFNINENLWVAAGYHHLLHDGEVFQYRPLVKIGYNFDNGLSISNRTRMQIAGDGAKSDAGSDYDKDQLRFDNRIAYAFSDAPVAVSYNNVYYINDAANSRNTMEHELRATWSRNGVQPYVEYRNQEDGAKDGYGHNNNVLVVGASYAF